MSCIIALYNRNYKLTKKCIFVKHDVGLELFHGRIENMTVKSFNFCWQFLRSRVGGSQISNKPFYKLASPEDSTLLFESRFECGNLLRGIKM